MWLERIRELIKAENRVVYVNAAQEWGTYFLVSDISSDRIPTVWVDLIDEDTSVSVSNKLSDAIERTFRVRLFGYGLPLSYCWRRLADSADELGTFKLAVTGAPPRGLNLGFTDSAAEQIIVCGTGFEQSPLVGRADQTLGPKDLCLLRTEAEALARDRLPQPQLLEVLRRSGGKYEIFLDGLQQSLGLPPLERPYPDGFKPAKGDSISPIPLIDSHVRRGYWMEALEVAVKYAPLRVPELVDNAAEQYLDRGMMARLYERLAVLPSSVRDHEQVMYWLVAAAIASNRHRSLVGELKRDVDIEAVPEVRALLAVYEPRKDSLQEAAAAYEARKTIVTTRMYAFALTQFGEPERALDLLMSALDEAQKKAKWRDQVTIASYIAHAVALTGDYTGSLTWAEWALRGFDKFGINDEIEKLYVTSQVQYMKLLVGDSRGMPALPRSLEPTDLVGVPTIEAVLSTLGDYELVFGDRERALALYRANQSIQSRDQAGHFALDVCRALLSIGESETAVDEAEGAVALAEDTNELNRLKARLARAIVYEVSARFEAGGELEACLELSLELKHWDIAAIAAMSLASHYLKDGSVTAAGQVLSRCSKGLKHLGDSGWELFGGWIDNLPQVRGLWRETRNPIKLEVLGEPVLRSADGAVTLSLRNAEILTVLAMHPEGLSGEQLGDKLYSASVSPSTLKAALSRLRSTVPIASQPYTISGFVHADFLLVEDLCRRGKTTDALLAYKGPLLRESAAPAVVAHREYLDEAVRQAAMRTDDVDSLFEYAQRRHEDLEVWEYLRSLMEDDDSRLSFVEARVLRLHDEWGIAE